MQNLFLLILLMLKHQIWWWCTRNISVQVIIIIIRVIVVVVSSKYVHDIFSILLFCKVAGLIYLVAADQSVQFLLSSSSSSPSAFKGWKRRKQIKRIQRTAKFNLDQTSNSNSSSSIERKSNEWVHTSVSWISFFFWN